MEHTRLPYLAYRMLISLDENGKNCWVTGIREVLCKTGFYFVWLQQGVGDVKSFLCVFKRTLLDMFTQEWTANIRDKERYVTYRCFKTPQWGAADAEIKVPSGEYTELKRSPFKA